LKGISYYRGKAMMTNLKRPPSSCNDPEWTPTNELHEESSENTSLMSVFERVAEQAEQDAEQAEQDAEHAIQRKLQFRQELEEMRDGLAAQFGCSLIASSSASTVLKGARRTRL